jgi:GxxExxY protein
MKILVWLSGGVDSAVAAYLLQQQWHEVVAGFMLNYMDESDPNCTTKADLESFHQVRQHLGISQYEIFDYRQEYEQLILNYIYEGYQQGITPNPDVYCNSLVKFDLFAKEAKQMGFDKIATGHYARVRRSEDDQKIRRWSEELKEEIDKKTYAIIGICIKIHNEFGNVLTEKQYENILKDSLIQQWFTLKQQVPIDIVFEGKKYGTRYIDLVIDGQIVLELKTLKSEYELKKWYKQTRSYLNLWKYSCGLLIDFGWEKLRYHRLNNPNLISSTSLLSSESSFHLLRGVDYWKDQSYFLSQLTQEQLSFALFPLWAMTKEQVRALAHEIELPNASRPDSQGLCFVGKVRMADFLRDRLGSRPGNIILVDGTIVGQHDGAYQYTIGQRRNIKLPFQAYVVGTDPIANTVIVAHAWEEDLLYSDSIEVRNWHWISDLRPDGFACHCKIRYRQELQECTIWLKAEKAKDAENAKKAHSNETISHIDFAQPIKGVAPWQIVVCYDGDEVIGSGVIQQWIWRHSED